MHDDPTGNQTALMQSLASAKFALAFSTRGQPRVVHPPEAREYLTGRWTDSLASGAVVAGIAPRCAAADELLWPGATLELASTDLAAGVQELAEAVRRWTRRSPAESHRRALERLDWRWRFRRAGRRSQRRDRNDSTRSWSRSHASLAKASPCAPARRAEATARALGAARRLRRPNPSHVVRGT